MTSREGGGTRGEPYKVIADTTWSVHQAESLTQKKLGFKKKGSLKKARGRGT